MLVLSRKRDESIMVDGGIKFTIVDIRGDKVRVGIEAPRELGVHREEVWLAIEAAQEAAKAKVQGSNPKVVEPQT